MLPLKRPFESIRQATNWGKIFVDHISEKGLALDCIKNSQNTILTKYTTQLKKRYMI